jgi:hypothetical protein
MLKKPVATGFFVAGLNGLKYGKKGKTGLYNGGSPIFCEMYPKIFVVAGLFWL